MRYLLLLMLLLWGCYIDTPVGEAGPGVVTAPEPQPSDKNCQADSDCKIIKLCCGYDSVSASMEYEEPACTECQPETMLKIYSPTCLSGKCIIFFEREKTCDNVKEFNGDRQKAISEIKQHYPDFECKI
jgi:hypothetical protein